MLFPLDPQLPPPMITGLTHPAVLLSGTRQINSDVKVDDPTDSPPKLKHRIIASCCCYIGFLKLVLLFSTVVQCCIVVVPALQQAQVTVSE